MNESNINFMKILNSNVIHAIVVVFVILPCCSTASEGEYWSKYSVSIPLNVRIYLNMKPELRFNEGASSFYYWKTYFGPQVRICPFFDVAAYYAPKGKKERGGWNVDHLGYLDGIFKCQWFHLKFSDRNRFEYNVDEEELKYRNRVKVTRPGMLGSRSVTFFLSDEIFYHVDAHTLDENRGSAGVSVNITPCVGVEMSLMHLSKKKNEWRRTIVIVSHLKMNF